MPNFTLYHDLEPHPRYLSHVEGVPCALRDKELTLLGLDPAEAGELLFSLLIEPWRIHPAGARVVIDPNRSRYWIEKKTHLSAQQLLETIEQMGAELAEARENLSRKGRAGRKPIHNFASKQERDAYYNRRRKHEKP